MNVKAIATISLSLAVASLTLGPGTARAADDGAALYKTKCSMCHGADGAGKPAIKAPSLISEEAKKKSDADLTGMIANGGKEKKVTHAFSKKGVTDEQVKSLVNYIRELQKTKK
jgi:mono/diheme cytochrome c family protein